MRSERLDASLDGSRVNFTHSEVSADQLEDIPKKDMEPFHWNGPGSSFPQRFSWIAKEENVKRLICPTNLAFVFADADNTLRRLWYIVVGRQTNILAIPQQFSVDIHGPWMISVCTTVCSCTTLIRMRQKTTTRKLLVGVMRLLQIHS